MLSPNTLLQNRYRIKHVIARGGMGVVYEAEAVHLGRKPVAVKETLFDDDELREQFERKAVVLANLSHPVLPKVTDHFTEGDGQFLVMEFIEGDDLEKLLKKYGAPFPPRQVIEWADRLLDALNYIHTQYPPVIHRDIKPSNLKLTPRGQIMLLDFGLAKNATTPTRPGGSVHAYTKEYAPPEQIKGTGTDARCDLYSLGATFYHLLTNELPADAKLRAEMMAVPMPDPLKPAHLVNRQLPMPLSVIIARAMAVDRERRYPTAAAMREALRQAWKEIEDTLLQADQDFIALPEQERPKQDAARLLAEQRLAEDARRAAAETERLQREETERLRQQEAARLLREKEEAERKQREARERELAEQRRRAEETHKQSELVPDPPRGGRGKRLAMLAAAVLLLFLLGYWLWNASDSGGGQTQLANGPTASPAASPARPTPAAKAPERVEVLRYAQKYAADGSFRLRFTPRQNGYLYLVALDDQDIPITLLTNRHAYEVEGRGNRLTAGTEFVFPPGAPLTLSGNKKSAPFTLIFSPVELKEPGFLNAAKLRELTSAEQRALAELKRRAQAQAPRTAPASDGETMTALPSDNQMLVFEIIVRRRTPGS